ncbi:hypothetical protein [Mesorhizobium sp. M0968]|uniref:hypothetical protein n=1 Tax=Mesorhizobium sp. M0968 TaxID=2957037 RepID=UPI00333D9439
MLPGSLQRRFKTFWSRHRKLSRMSRRKAFEDRDVQFARANHRLAESGDRVWNEIWSFFRPVDKPAGLETFLEEIGL